MAGTIKIKRGDSFSRSFIFWQDKSSGIRYPMAGVIIKSDVRTQKGGAKIASLTATVVDPVNSIFNLKNSEPTTSWPVATLDIDIEFSLADGTIISTETFYIECGKDITRDGN